MRRPWLSIVVVAVLTSSCLYAQQETLRARVDLVVVPASVRDVGGKPVYDLKAADFSITEDGRPQQIFSLSIDPAPLSAAFLIDTGIGGNALRRFAGSIISLTDTVTEFDEAALYRFDHSIVKLTDFTSSHETLEMSLEVVRKLAEGKHNQPGSAPLLIAPGRGPRWLRAILDIGAGQRNLNDALFAAATDLEARSPERRKVIVVMSDGQVAGKTVHSLEATRDRLVQSQIQVFAVGVDNALLGGAASILNTFASATGGDVYRARNQNAMETAFAQIMVQARHQYVLSYVSNNEAPGPLPVKRRIEVKAKRPGLNVKHRQSYFQYPKTN